MYNNNSFIQDIINLKEAFTYESDPLKFLWHGFLHKTVGALIGTGGTGKSYFALQAAMSIASNGLNDMLKMNILEHYNNQVAYISTEDPNEILIKRVHALGKHFSPDAQENIHKNLLLTSLVGSRIDIFDQKITVDFLRHFIAYRLIIIDTLSRIHSLDENNNVHMAALISQLEYIASETGASILFLHHTNKQSNRDTDGDKQHAIRGASALVDNVRYCSFVSKMSEAEAKQFNISLDERYKYVKFGVSKQNYDVIEPDRWYKRVESGVLLPAHLNQEQGSKLVVGGGRTVHE